MVTLIASIMTSSRMFQAAIHAGLPHIPAPLPHVKAQQAVVTIHYTLVARTHCHIVTHSARCSWNSYFALILLVAYLTVAQVLLVNLLIAMMASRYEQVQLEHL